MAKIENYTCDFCGVGVQSLVDLQALDMEMRSETVKQSYTYSVCGWCASVFSKTTTKDLFLEHLRTKFVIVDEQASSDL